MVICVMKELLKILQSTCVVKIMKIIKTMEKRRVIVHYIVGCRNKNNYNVLIINV